MTTGVIGEEGFRWFVGIVEDRDDPKKMGRLRVRIYNVHPFSTSGEPDKVKVPTEHLPWASCVNSIFSAGIIKDYGNDLGRDGVGITPLGTMVGSTVFGFFVDGNECQIPVVLGSLAALVGETEDNEIPKAGYEQNPVESFKKGKEVKAAAPFAGEPPSPYGAKYPYNKSIRTESGHLIEVDDTTANERIHIMHRSGTYIEIDKDGRTVIKTVDKRCDITVDDNQVYIGGNMEVRVMGNVNMVVDGTYTIESKGNMLFKAPRIDFNP